MQSKVWPVRAALARLLVCAFVAIAAQIPAGPAWAQEAAFERSLPADRAFVAALIESIPGYRQKSAIEQVQALRVEVFRRTQLAATSAYLAKDDVLLRPLREVYETFAEQDQGVWCAGTALLLARVYKAAGFDAWIYSFGRSDILTHATTLVRVNGDIYLQDSYLNFEYLDTNGRPLAFTKVIDKISGLDPPRVNAPVESKLALFPNAPTAKSWVGKANAERLSCAQAKAVLRCQAPITLDQFLKVFFLMPQTYDFLEGQGWPRQVDYLLLYPMSVTAPFADDQPDAHPIYEHVHRRSKPGPVKPAKGWRVIDLQIFSKVPGHPAGDPAPVEVVTPPTAYGYGAVSAPIVVGKPLVFRARVEALEGRAGVSLVSQDGRRLLSKETVVAAGAGATDVLYRVEPDGERPSLLIRNYGDEGRTSRVKILATELSPEGDLPVAHRAQLDLDGRS